MGSLSFEVTIGNTIGNCTAESSSAIAKVSRSTAVSCACVAEGTKAW